MNDKQGVRLIFGLQCVALLGRGGGTVLSDGVLLVRHTCWPFHSTLQLQSFPTYPYHLSLKPPDSPGELGVFCFGLV